MQNRLDDEVEPNRLGPTQSRVDLRTRLLGYGLLVIPSCALLLLLGLHNPWVPVALVIPALVFSIAVGPSSLSSPVSPRQGTLVQHFLSVVAVLAIVTLVGVAGWAFWDLGVNAPGR